MRAKPWSNPATTEVVRRLLREALAGGAEPAWADLKLADVGAGRGHFSHQLGEELRQRHGLDPGEHVFPCDLFPESFEYDAVTCRRTEADGRLPFEDASFDAVVSVEVIEHVEDQFAFLRELLRIAKPGAPVVVTTPNTHHMVSRLRSLTWGFPQLYDPLSLEVHDPRMCGGHIHPISPWFLAYTGLRAGLVGLELHGDRRKTSAALWALLLSPLLLLGRARNALRLAKKKPDVARQNDAWMKRLNGWTLLTARTAILAGRRPGPGEQPADPGASIR
jgi:SAM-dependent methyltransferase